MFTDRKAREIIRLVASIRLFACLRSPVWTICAFHTICMVRSGWYMGSACRVLRKITMTHGIQSKISVCLSVIRKYSRSRAAHSCLGAFTSEKQWVSVCKGLGQFKQCSGSHPCRDKLIEEPWGWLLMYIQYKTCCPVVVFLGVYLANKQTNVQTNGRQQTYYLPAVNEDVKERNGLFMHYENTRAHTHAHRHIYVTRSTPIAKIKVIGQTVRQGECWHTHGSDSITPTADGGGKNKIFVTSTCYLLRH